jgi:phosphate starvation-inducible protein PhoH and related proteins
MSRKADRKLIQMFDEKARQEYVDGTIKKRFTLNDLKIIQPLSYAQEEVFHIASQDKSIALIGSAGSGKTALAMYLALRDVLNPETHYTKVVVVRSPVQLREIGFTAGSLEEKAAMYEAPYIGLCDELFPFKKAWENLKKAGKVEFILTTFIRGITLQRGTIVVFDEIQNTTFDEARSVITRLGHQCKIFMAGDTKQTDLKKKNDVSGLSDLLRVFDRIDSVEVVNFTSSDCVRSGFVRDFLIACEEIGL